ncbi:MAG TPA: biotin-dependent carboxyltransferase family protein [Lapillicoccus sp.]|nr:biotin-dependent carboxyltransferase family protein [Lapillicoccus sp.]
MTTLRVVQPGPYATVQDLGRPGWFSAGVGVAGAADVDSHRLGNRLVGNAESAAAIECVLGGLELDALDAVTLAVTGAPAPVFVDETPTGPAAVLRLHAGQRLRLGLAQAGMRVYVAVRGGVDVPPVLGSRSRDTMAGLGPAPLTAGQELPIGHDIAAHPRLDAAPVRRITLDPVSVRVGLGPRDDWFARPTDLFIGHWVVTDRLDRLGARLARPDGLPGLTRRRDAELPTEGMPLGAVQVPPSGEPVVFLADHPITGGYPVIAVVRSADIPLVAQARPGQHLLFRPAPGAGVSRPTS